jgi:staphylococcal nuclease domain-containing protein 1
MNETNFPSTGRSFVKSVISGDTLVLRGKATNGPPTEVIFTLTNIVAPRMSRGSEPEEKNAFKSREFLRTALVGKEVQFHVQNSSSNDRHFGSLSVHHPIYNENDVARMLIRSGAVALKRVDTAKRNYTDEQIYLEDLETIAKDEKLGIWSEEVIERNVNQTFTGDARKFLQNYQNKAIEGI